LIVGGEKSQGNSVHLLSVIDKGETAEEIEARMKYAEKKIDAIQNKLMPKVKINVTSEVVSTKAGYRTCGAGVLASSKGTATHEIKGVEEIIISKAEEMNASLIALSSVGKGYLDEADIGIGSVAKELAVGKISAFSQAGNRIWLQRKIYNIVNPY